MEFLKVWVMGSNGKKKVIWAVLHLKLRKQGKAAHNQETFPRKMAKFRLWKNAEGHNRGPGKAMEFSKLYMQHSEG